ncbi:unnamed protein product [Mytilus edulis]|uniref:EGF-like domain-containing protein n=1 Tax=Mytilus edulis TaxID=6550 RepID=A0A8S3SE98_MYTED|nr:unnamed protein product [Mytilus edulis]
MLLSMMLDFIDASFFDRHSSFFPHHSTYAYCCEDFHEVNGLCEGCPAGQYGLKCNLSCPADHYGFRCKYKCNCFNDGVCHKVNGCVCNDGFSGDSCEKVKACPPGKFGNRCQQMCNCSGGFTCDSETGKCVCPTQDLCNHGSTTKSNVQGVKTTTFIKDITSEALYQRVTQTYDGAVADNISNYRTDRGQVVCEPLVIYNIVVVCALVFIWLLIILYTVKKKISTKRDPNIHRNTHYENKL